MTRLPIFRRIALAVGLCLGLAACHPHGSHGSSAAARPQASDIAAPKATDRGLYRVEVQPEGGAAPVGPMHRWTVRVATADGKPVPDAARIAVDGGMPEHGHGLPTKPRVTQALGDGRFLVEGMKFNMPGWWTLSLSVDAAPGADSVTFNLVL
ncbi:MAG TPA: FixH family protein [Azospirillaceae bacterium]|nr:FixH family protein [Azospirillaceae bacterium]